MHTIRMLRMRPMPAPFQLVAGHPILDFVNTLDWRFRSSGSEELLNDYADLLRFSQQSGLMTREDVRKLTSGDSATKRRKLSSAKKFRECLATILYAITAGATPRAEDLRALSSLLRATRREESLKWRGFRFQWEPSKNATDSLSVPLRRLTSAAAEFLTSDDLHKLRTCANEGCRWLFIDVTKNGGRRWCDMRLCGNRIKAKQFRERHRDRDTI